MPNGRATLPAASGTDRPVRSASPASTRIGLMLRYAACLLAGLALTGPAAAQTLRYGMMEDPDALDPTLARTFASRMVFAALCDKLVDIGPI